MQRIRVIFDGKTFDVGSVEEWQKTYPNDTVDDLIRNFSDGWSDHKGNKLEAKAELFEP